MTTRFAFGASIVVVSSAMAAHALSQSVFTRIEEPAQPSAFAIYADEALGSGGGHVGEVWDMLSDDQPVVRNVTRPSLTPFLPSPDKATGAAVIIVPGGGFTLIAMRNEGWDVAKRLANAGIAAFVLKYRLNPTPMDEAAASKYLVAKAQAMMSAPDPTLSLHDMAATVDALQSLQVVRARAAKWKIDPTRVGLMGFSAGSIPTMEAALTPDKNARPAFIGYIYGPMAARPVPADAPPMFAALANDDKLFGKRGFGIVESWYKAGRPVELHAYEKGDHAFGVGKPGTTTTLMIPEYVAWLQSRGLLGTSH